VPELVGRERELRTLGRLLERARAGRGSVALIEGEPGIGKTRLLSDTLSSAGALGLEVLVGTGQELERDRPFGPIAAALGLEVDASDPRRARIARLLRPGDHADSWERGPALRYQVLDSILALVEDLSAARPVALGLDDLQWADPSTLLVLRRMGARLASLPVVILIASRPISRTADLAAVLDALRPEGLVEVQLGPLSEDEVAELAGSLMKGAAGQDFQAQLSGAAGNPLLVTEFVAAAQEDAAHRGEGGEAGVSSIFSDSVLRRLRFLTPEALHALRLASVLGSVFSVDDLSLVVGRPATDLLPALDEARSSHLLMEAEDRMRFRHDLVRDAVYADLPSSVRAALHAHAARVLGSAGRPALQVAAHVVRGSTPGDEEAVRWLHRAGRESLELEPAVAAGLLERAVALAGPAAASPQLRMDLLVACVWAGRYAEAESLGTQLLDSDGGAPDEDHVRLFLARALMSQGRGHEGLSVLEPALHEGSDGSRATLFAMGTTLRVVVGDVEGARDLGETGVRVAERSGEPADEAFNLSTLGMAERLAGNPRRGADLAGRALDRARRARSIKPYLVNVHNVAGRLLMDAERTEEAEAALQSGRRLAEEHGIAWGLPECHSLRAELLLHAGRWDDAVAEAETAIDLCATLGAWHAFGMAHSIQALVATRRNDLPRAQRHVMEARARLAIAPNQHGRPWIHWTSGLLLEAMGDLEGSLQRLLEAWRDTAGIVSDEATFGPDLVRVALGFGKERLAAETAAALASREARSDVSRIDGAAMLCRGMVDRGIGDFEGAVQAYRAARRPYELARALELSGEVLAGLGSSAAGIAHLRESAEIYEGLAAARDVSRVEARLRGLGAPRGRRGGRKRPAVGWHSLTQTEEAVVRLVRDGLRNREIAERLFISQRTVETHLTHIFRKLSVSSRTELVATASQALPATP
jgi:DNA-binding CsgD family transcriptional regulator